MIFEELDKLLNKTEALTKYKDTKSEVLALRERVKKLHGELSRLKNLKIIFSDKEINLETFEKKISQQTLKVYGEEIERKVDQILKEPSSWSPWFKQLVETKIQAGIKRSLNETFFTKVQTAINHAKQAEWPKFLDDYTRKKITPVCKEFIKNQLINPITIEKVCDKCGTTMSITLTPNHIIQLIKLPSLTVDCLNFLCKDLFFRHKVHVTLGDIVMHITRGSNIFPMNQKAGI